MLAHGEGDSMARCFYRGFLSRLILKHISLMKRIHKRHNNLRCSKKSAPLTVCQTERMCSFACALWTCADNIFGSGSLYQKVDRTHLMHTFIRLYTTQFAVLYLYVSGKKHGARRRIRIIRENGGSA